MSIKIKGKSSWMTKSNNQSFRMTRIKTRHIQRTWIWTATTRITLTRTFNIMRRRSKNYIGSRHLMILWKVRIVCQKLLILDKNRRAPKNNPKNKGAFKQIKGKIKKKRALPLKLRGLLIKDKNPLKHLSQTRGPSIKTKRVIRHPNLPNHSRDQRKRRKLSSSIEKIFANKDRLVRLIKQKQKTNHLNKQTRGRGWEKEKTVINQMLSKRAKVVPQDNLMKQIWLRFRKMVAKCLKNA